MKRIRNRPQTVSKSHRIGGRLHERIGSEKRILQPDLLKAFLFPLLNGTLPLADFLERITYRYLDIYVIDISREIQVRLNESRTRNGCICFSRRLAQPERSHGETVHRPFVRHPAKAFQTLILTSHLGNRISITCCRIKVIDPVDIAISEIRGKHFALLAVCRGERIVFFKIEKCRCPAESIKASQLPFR